MLFLARSGDRICCRKAFNSSQPQSRVYRPLRWGIQWPCCFAKGRFLRCMLLRKGYVFYLLPDSFQQAPSERVKPICHPTLKQRKRLSQVVDGIVSATSSGLFKKLRGELGVLVGRRNCVIKYMGKKKQVLKFQTHLLRSMMGFFYIQKEFSPGFDVTFSM